MVKNIFVERDRTDLIRRVHSLRPDAQPRWGMMNVCQMLRHVGGPMRTGMGELPVPVSGGRFLTSAFGRNLLIFVLPWPKGRARTAPEYDERRLKTPAPEFAAGVDFLIETIERFASLPPDFRFVDHPAFGTLTRKQWGAVNAKHLNHHLSQFGV